MNRSQTQLTMTAYPGEEINISVVAVGQEVELLRELLSFNHYMLTRHRAIHTSTIPLLSYCTNITLKPVYHVNRKIFFNS